MLYVWQKGQDNNEIPLKSNCTNKLTPNRHFRYICYNLMTHLLKQGTFINRVYCVDSKLIIYQATNLDDPHIF